MAGAATVCISAGVEEDASRAMRRSLFLSGGDWCLSVIPLQPGTTRMIYGWFGWRLKCFFAA